MLKTHDFDLRALLDELEQPLIQVSDVVEVIEVDDSFDGVCTQHDGCRTI